MRLKRGRTGRTRKDLGLTADANRRHKADNDDEEFEDSLLAQKMAAEEEAADAVMTEKDEQMPTADTQPEKSNQGKRKKKESEHAKRMREEKEGINLGKRATKKMKRTSSVHLYYPV
jgi:hypothetical protein